MRVWRLLFLMVCFSPVDAQIVDSINNPPQWMVWNTQNSDIPYNYVTDLDLDSKGNVWMGFCTPFFGGGGFGRLSFPNNWLHFDRNNFPMFSNRIENECVSALQINDNDSLYVSLNNTPSASIIFNNERLSLIYCGATYDNINRTYLKNGHFYAVASSGFYAFKDSCIHYIRLPEYKRVFSLAFDRNDKMFIGTEGWGILFYENGQFSTLNLPDTVFNGSRVSSMFFNKTETNGGISEQLWFGSGSSQEQWAGVGVWDGDTLIMYRKADLGTNTGAVMWLERDRRGRVWVGTRDGMAIYDKGSWTAYNVGSSFIPHPTVNKFVFDKRGNAWISTFGGGLAVFNPEGLLFHEPVDLFQKSDITLYPVPAEREFNMRFRAEKDGQISTLIRDLHGQVIRTYPAQNVLHGDNNLTFDLTGLPPGMLLIEVRTVTQNFIYRMVKL